MNTFFHLTSKDPERKCHIIKPFTVSKLNAEVLSNGKVRTENAILNLKKKIISITNASKGELALCCKNPVGQDYNNELLTSFRELFPSVREIRKGGKIQHLEVSTIPILEKNKGWQQLTPYHVCKLTTAYLKPIKGKYAQYKALNLTEDCYTANCDNQNTFTLERLLGEETNPIEYSYYDDLKMYQSLEDANLDYIKIYLFKYNAINKVLTNDDFGNYIIHVATKYYNKKVYNLIVAMRPNVNVVNSDGDTPLHVACLHGKVDCLNELFKLGAEVDMQNNKGMTPLMMAVQFHDNNPKKSNPLNDFRLSPVAIMVKALLNKGANINTTNNKGETVLHIIIKHGQTSPHLSMMVRMLMENGVDVSIKDNNGKTALELTGNKVKKLEKNKISEILPTNDNINSEGFQVSTQNETDFTTRELELKEIQTMLFNQMIRNNADKYSGYINVSEIPAGAPVEVLNYVCSGSNPEIQGIEDKEKCERLGGAFTKVKNPTTKVKLELIPESDKLILAEEEEDLYLDKYPESVLEQELPEEIRQINQMPEFNNNISDNINSKTTKTLQNDTYVDRDDMIQVPMKNGNLQSNANANATNLNNKRQKDNFKSGDNTNKQGNMLLSESESEHPEIASSSELTSSITNAMDNSKLYMINTKSNISKSAFAQRTKSFVYNNIVGIIVVIILLIALIKLMLSR
jgi:hypothetical protein